MHYVFLCLIKTLANFIGTNSKSSVAAWAQNSLLGFGSLNCLRFMSKNNKPQSTHVIFVKAELNQDLIFIRRLNIALGKPLGPLL